jgi:hypothetical protein
MALQTAGSDDTALVHDRRENLAGGFGLQNDVAAIGLDRASIADC